MKFVTLFITLFLLQVSPSLAENLFLIIGQSNAAGRGDLPANPVALEGVEVLSGNNSFVAAFPNLNIYSTVRNLNQAAGFNIGYTFAERIREARGEEVQLVVNARGGTSIVNWFPGVVDDAAPLSYFDEAVRRTKAALAANSDATLRGILWHQGESNRNRGAYMADLQTLIGLFRAELGDVPFVTGQLSFERVDNQTFNTNLLQLPALVADTAVVSAEGLATSDGTHFTAGAAQTFGRRYADEMLALLDSEPPVVEPPVVDPPVEPGPVGALLFADTFNRGDSSNLNASSNGQSGSLSPLSYASRTFNAGAPDINGNALRMVGSGSSVVRDGSLVFLNHNFTEPAILEGEGFSVSVDITEYATTGSTRQMSIGVGQSLAELMAQSTVRTSETVSDLLVSYRGTTDTLEIHKQGALFESLANLPADPVTMRIEYSLHDFSAGSVVGYAVFFNDDPTVFASGTFVWSGSNENYLSLSSNLNEDSHFDNLEVRGGLPVDDYPLWTSLYPDVDLTEPDGDVDEDGLTNQEERLWGLDPTNATSNDPYTALLGDDGSFSYTRRDPSLTGFRYRVFTSIDLLAWEEDLGSVSVTSDSDTDSVQIVAVTLSAESVGGRLFVRIGAEP